MSQPIRQRLHYAAYDLLDGAVSLAIRERRPCVEAENFVREAALLERAEFTSVLREAGCDVSSTLMELLVSSAVEPGPCVHLLDYPVSSELRPLALAIHAQHEVPLTSFIGMILEIAPSSLEKAVSVVLDSAACTGRTFVDERGGNLQPESF